MDVYVVVLSTAGNQNYIFGSNKRRENVGASHLITCVEGRWLDAALAALDGPGDPRRDWRVEAQGAEVVTANAGGVTLLVRADEPGREAAVKLVGDITEAALREAPGLDVCGVVGTEPVPWGTGEALDRGIAAARELLAVARMRRRGPRLRFPGVPIAARCGSSGLPAHRAVRFGPDRAPEARSAPSVAKLRAFDAALSRLTDKMGLADTEAARNDLVSVVDHLNFTADWVAVVHADGNGMGKVFQGFADIMAGATAREYVDALRGLSEGVDECARDAFRSAVDRLRGDRFPVLTKVPPVLPLVLGGDDLTVVCDGRVALNFAHRYLTEFTRRAAEKAGVGGLLEAAGRQGLGACAGVAVVKRQYPFHSAVHLAEELTAEAKSVKRELDQSRSALSFHVLNESAHADLARLRENQNPLEEGTHLTAMPYVVGAAEGEGWARRRHWSDLERRVTALTSEREDGSKAISAGQAHDLRSGLFRGRAAADARLAALTVWSGDAPEVRALTEDGSLFWRDGDEHRTGLLDALNAAPFLTPGDRA
nr:hypothetical protein [Actinomadura flavalba]